MAFWTKKSEVPSPAAVVPQPATSALAVSSPTATPKLETSKAEDKLNTVSAEPTSSETPVAPRGAIRTAIGLGTKIQGRLSFDNPVQIDGQVKGEISSSRHVVISKTAQIDARIVAPSVTVLGSFEGTIVASEKLEIRAGATVSGAVQTPLLVLEEGALLNAKVSMGLDVSSPSLSEKVERSVDAPAKASRTGVTPRSGASIETSLPSTSQIH
ncbi:MAG: polymer-forming cytoskeletal protein [Deltaproteobacteria bacterium]|nr:polymer-forming cytoskeletal protein [Deltaproteobacteria bacterium]